MIDNGYIKGHRCFPITFNLQKKEAAQIWLMGQPPISKPTISKDRVSPVPPAWGPGRNFCSFNILLSFSIPPSFSCSPFLSFGKTELFCLLEMCFELNAQLHNSCYVTCRAELWPCPDSWVLLLSPSSSFAVVRGSQHWSISCPDSESTKSLLTLSVCCLTTCMRSSLTPLHWIMNYLRIFPFTSDMTEGR